MAKEVKGAIIKHFSEPVCSLSAGWTQVNFNDPRVKLSVKHYVETVDLKAIVLLLLCLLNRFERSPDHIADLREHLGFPSEVFSVTLGSDIFLKLACRHDKVSCVLVSFLL